MARAADGDRRHGRRGEGARGARDHRGGNRRPADRGQPGCRDRGHRSADRRPDRGDLGRRGEPSRLPRGQGRASGWPRARWRCSTPVAAAPSSPSGRATAWTSASASTWAPSVHRAVRPRWGRDARGDREAMAAIAADLVRLDGQPRVDALVGMGGAIGNLAAVKHGLAMFDPDVVQGTTLDRRRDRPPDRAVPQPDAEARRSHRGAAARAGRGDPRRRRPGAHHHGEAPPNDLTVSDRGLRHGLLIERFGG